MQVQWNFMSHDPFRFSYYFCCIVENKFEEFQYKLIKYTKINFHYTAYIYYSKIHKNKVSYKSKQRYEIFNFLATAT